MSLPSRKSEALSERDLIRGSLDDIVIDAANPYNPFGRRRSRRVDAQLAHAVLGREFSLVAQRRRADQTRPSQRSQDAAALCPPAECARIIGCTPLNLFGGQGDGSGTITPAMLDWIGFVQRDNSAQKLTSFTFNMTGDLFDMPTGPLAFAAGVERRRQSGRFDPDPIVAAGDTAGLPAEPTTGGFDVTELYGELELPLLTGAYLGRLGDISAAARYFDYSTFDSGVTGKIGLRWRSTETLLFRGAWAEGFRAPSIGELFGGRTRLDAAIADPCAGFLTTSVAQTVVDNCIAAGVPRDGSYTQLGGQISVLTGGNAFLDPETSKSLTLALAWRPAWAMPLDWVGDLRF